MRVPHPLPAVHQDLAQHVGAVGHQSVDPEVEQLAHLVRARRRSRRGPGGPRRAPARRSPRSPRSCQRHPVAAPGARRRGRAAPSPRAAAARTGSRPTPSGPYDVATGRLTPAGGTRAAGSRRTSRRTTRSWAPVRSTRSARPVDRGVGLEVDVEAGAREVLEQVGHHAGSARCPPIRAVGRSTYVRSRDGAGARGDPVQDVVVEGQQHAVAGEVDVGLEVGVAERHGVLERGEGVLQADQVGVVRAAAVREREHGRRRPDRRRGTGSPVCGRVTRAVSTAMRPRWPRIARRAHPRSYSARVAGSAPAGSGVPSQPCPRTPR